MNTKKVIKWVGITIGGLLLCLVVAVLLAMAIGVTINLDGLRQKVDAAATQALGREVALEGSVNLVVSFQPSLEIQGVRIANPSDWAPGDFVRVALLRGKIDILPLLTGSICIGEFTARGVAVFLETQSDGKNNWRFNVSGSPDSKKKAPAKATAIPIKFVELRELTSHQMALTYRDGGLEKTFTFNLDELDGTAAVGEPLSISFRGTFQEKNYRFALSGSPIDVVMDPQKPHSLEFSGNIDERPVKIKYAFNPSRDVTHDTLEISAKKASLGSLLRDLGIAEGMEVGVDELSMTVKGRGNNLKEILEQSDLSLDLKHGLWVWNDAKFGDSTRFAIDRGHIRSSAGKPMALEINGRIQDAPFELDITGDSLAELVAAQKPWTMQLTTKFPSATLRGKGALDRSGEIPVATYDLSLENVDVAEILRRFHVPRDDDARIQTIHIDAVARGRNPSELLELSDVSVELGNGHYTWQDLNSEHSFKFVLDKGIIQSPAGKPIKVDVNGKLAKKAYALSISGAKLATLLDKTKPWSLNLSGKFEGTPLQGKGTFTRAGESPVTELNLVTGKMDLGDILSWLDIAQGIEATVDRNKLSITARGSNFTELMQKSDLGYALQNGSWSLKNPNMASVLQVNIAEFSLGKLSGKPIKLTTSGQLQKPSGKSADKPVPFFVEATARQISAPASKPNKSINTNKKSFALKVNGQIADSNLQLNGSFDPYAEIPTASLDLAAEQVNAGEILRWLEITQGLEATVGKIHMNITTRGGNSQEILANSDFRTTVESGRLTLRDANSRASADIDIARGQIQALAGKPISVAMDGRLKNTPVAFEIKTEKLAAFATEIERLPLDLNAEIAGTRLELTADVALPITRMDLNLDMSIAGEKLNSLDELLEVALPPLGPYALKGLFSINAEGYQLSNLGVNVGTSHLTGKARLTTTQERPRLDVDLTTHRLQMNDFDLGQWSAVEEKENSEQLEEEKKFPESIKENTDQIQTLLNPEVMGALNAELALKVDEVLSGKDTLGSGSVYVKLEKGRLAIQPLRLSIPGGLVDLAFTYQPTGKEVMGEAFAKINNFDYGILARRIDPDTTMKGLLSLDIKLDSHGPDYKLILGNMNGKIDFGIWPQDLEAGIFDLWAVNLLLALLPQVDKGESSKVNCVIGQFDLKDGVLKEHKMMIDTTRMRVKGEVRANFKTQEIYVYAKSSGKRPEFFSLATPVEVKGKFQDFQPGVAPGGLIGSVIHFITSPLHVPLRRLLNEDLPPEGHDVCAGSFERTPDE